MSRVDPIKVIENPLASVTGGDDLGEGGINEARIPLLRHSLKRHSSPSTNDEKRGPISGSSVTSTSSTAAQPGRSSSSQIISFGSNDPSPKSGLSPSGSSTTSNINPCTVINGTRAAGITQSQSLNILGNLPARTSVSKYVPGSTSVHRGTTGGTVVVVSGKEGEKPTSGYVAIQDPVLITSSTRPTSSSGPASSQHSRSKSCYQDDAFCIAVTKKSEGSPVDTALVRVSRIKNATKHVIAETKMIASSRNSNSNVDDPGGGMDSTSGGGRSLEKSGSRGDDGECGEELNLSSSTLHAIEDGGDRETWSQGLDFLLSIIGFAVDLANVWRFPYFCYKNGGGAFLIPYFLMLALSAIPVFYMELLLGQSIRQGPISMWKICPLFKGVGYCAVTVSYFVSFYYNTIMGWSLHFTISSLKSPLPWTSCDNSWNTIECYSPEAKSAASGDNNTMTDADSGGGNEGYFPWGSDNTSLSQVTPMSGDENGTRHFDRENGTSPASEYFRFSVLDMGGHDIDNLGSPKPDLLACLAIIYCLLYVILFRGIRSTGKVVYVTALLPYLVMFILLIRGLMLEGAKDGIYYYLVPNMTKLWDIGVWSDAAKQIFFSSGAGFGVHLTYASYNNFHNNCYRDCLVTSCVNCFTSIFSGFVIFTFLGSMAHRQNRKIEDVVNVGPGLVFEVYPEAVGSLPMANFWSLLFFIMLIMLGIDSAMGGLECVVTGITDEFKPFFKRKKHGRECFMFFCVLLSFLIGMINVTRGGMYTFQFLDTYAAGSSLLLSVLFEILAVSWVYGLDQLCKDAEAMLGFAPGLYWRICWKFVSPTLIAVIIVLDLSQPAELTYEGYTYPGWAQTFGYIFTFIPITLVPIVGFIEFMKYPGDCMTKLSYSITPVSEHAAIKNGERIKRFQSVHWSYFR